MPHTSHKKKQARSKRQEVVDDDGWTRVTSQKPLAVAASAPDHATAVCEPHIEEAPGGVTQVEILAKYRDIEKRWNASESWKIMENTLKTRVLGSNTRVDNCVLFGSGTFTGLGQGWINRVHVGMYQLAAFEAIVDLVGKLAVTSNTLARGRLMGGLAPEHCTGLRPKAYAQEPLYNTQDRALLRTLSTQVVEDPNGFILLTNHSFAFCPGAEQFVVLQTLDKDPFIYLGGTLDSYIGSLGYLQSNVIDIAYEVYSTENTTKNGGDSKLLSLEEIEELKEEVFDSSGKTLDKSWVWGKRAQQEPDVRRIERFVRNKEVAKVPDLDVQDFPFHNTCLYWPGEAAGSSSGYQ